MPTVVEPRHARPRSESDVSALFADGWPTWITADREAARHIDRVRDVFADLELVVLDDDVPVAAAWGVPISWNGEPGALPSGYTDSLRRALDDDEACADVNTLVVMAAQVHPRRRGQGLAGQLLTAMRHLALERRWPRVVAPGAVRRGGQLPYSAAEGAAQQLSGGGQTRL